jgi:hypothetical protein
MPNGAPVHFRYRLAGLEAELRVETQRTIVKGGLQQPDPGGAALARAVEHGDHQPAADRLVLRRWIDRDGADAGDGAAFVEKVAANDISVLLGHHRVETRVRQQHRQGAGGRFRRRKIPWKIVLVVDCFERLETDDATSRGVFGSPRPQDHTHRSPLFG